jgi:hypothetical protein
VNRVPLPRRRNNNTGIHNRSARTANSILRPNYSSEEVALIPPHPDWVGLTLGNLKNIGGPAAAKLARAQNLTPIDRSDSELARVHNINMVLKFLGVSCAHLHSFPSSLDHRVNDEFALRFNIRRYPRGTASFLCRSRDRQAIDHPPRSSGVPLACVSHLLCLLEGCPVATPIQIYHATLIRPNSFLESLMYYCNSHVRIDTRLR